MNARGILWEAPGRARLTDITVRDPGPGELLIEVEYSLVSPGTEREWLESDQSHVVLGTTFPFVPGYSPAGRVLAVGAGVSGWSVGDAVVASSGVGAHASHVVAPATLSFHVPDGVSLREAVYFNIGMTAVHTVRLTGGNAGDSLTIVGQGPIGSIATQVAKARGFHPILALELDEPRRAQSADLGATHAVDPRNTEKFEAVLSELGGGSRATIDLSASPAGIDTAIHATAPLGTVVLSTAMNAPVTLNYGELFLKGLTVRGAFVMARMAESLEDVVQFLGLLSSGEVSVPQTEEDVFEPTMGEHVYVRVLAGDKTLAAPVFRWR